MERKTRGKSSERLEVVRSKSKGIKRPNATNFVRPRRREDHKYVLDADKTNIYRDKIEEISDG